MKAPSREQVVFADALQRTSAERVAFLAVACQGDTALLRRVEALLQAADSAGDFLEHPPGPGLSSIEAGTAVSELSEAPGDRIGRYKLLQEIGEGGCGVVY